MNSQQKLKQRKTEQAKAKGGKYFRGLRQTWIGQVEISRRDIDLFQDDLHKLII